DDSCEGTHVVTRLRAQRRRGQVLEPGQVCQHHPLHERHRLGREAPLGDLRHQPAAALDQEADALAGFQRLDRVVGLRNACSPNICRNNTCFGKYCQGVRRAGLHHPRSGQANLLIWLEYSRGLGLSLRRHAPARGGGACPVGVAYLRLSAIRPTSLQSACPDRVTCRLEIVQSLCATSGTDRANAMGAVARAAPTIVMARALTAKAAFWMAFMMISPHSSLLSPPEHRRPPEVTAIERRPAVGRTGVR